MNKDYVTRNELNQKMRNFNNYARGYNNFRDNYFNTEEDFLDWVKNSAPSGAYLKYVNIYGSVFACIIQKASSSYSSVLRFNYNGWYIQINRLVVGEWTGWGTID